MTRVFLAAVLAAGCSTIALAQPRITVTTVGDDLSADGTTSCGWLYDAAAACYAPFTYKGGVGFVRLPGKAPGGGSTLTVSGDGTAFGAEMDNSTNWQDLNCFGGYDAQGNPRPNLTNCVMPSIAHRYTVAGGWVNGGSLARTIDPATGRWVGGTRCDYTINSVYDTSADGRYVVGGAYSAVAINGAGNPSAGLCGDYFAFRWDSQTGEFLKLATTSHTTRADHASGDGSVVVGYDIGLIPDPAGGSYPDRRLVCWFNNAETILDAYGNQDSAPVNGPGTAVAAGATRAFCQATFGQNRMLLVKWVRSGSAWTPVNLGRPVDREDELGTIMPYNAIAAYGISDDGNTIVGTAWYSGSPGERNGTPRPFIWRSTLNNGRPLDLLDYLQQIDPGGSTQTPGMTITNAYGLSADGNRLMIICSDARTDCTEPMRTLETGFRGVLTLNPGAEAGRAPSLAMGPFDYSTRCTWAGWGAPFNVFAGGTWPLNYQWQREDPGNPGQWIDLQNACSAMPGETFPWDASWDYEGVHGPQLRVNVFDGATRDGLYRCVVSNAYGSVVSQPARLTFVTGMNPGNPASTVGCSAEPGVFTVADVGAGAEYRWEVCVDTGNDVWDILSEGTNAYPALGGTLSATGTRTNSVRIDPGTFAGGTQLLFRCHLADSCNSFDTDPATLTVGSPCGMADMGAQGGVPAPCGDGVLDNNDFVVFIDFFFNATPRADVGRQGGLPGSDGVFDNNDFVVFIDYFFGGCN